MITATSSATGRSATCGRFGTFSRPRENAVGLQSRPVVNLSFALDYAVDGLDPLPYHLTNLAIHVLAGLALFGVVRRTLLLPRLRDRFGQASTPLALAVALLWAVHPLQTESVTYVVQRYESMMGLFYLLAVYGLIRCGSSTHPYGWGAVTVAATLLALGSKEVAVSLPIMILLYDRVLLAGSFAESGVGDGGCTWACWRPGSSLPSCNSGGSAPLGRLRATGVVVRVCPQPTRRNLHYLRLVFWPHPLVLDYGWLPAQDRRRDPAGSDCRCRCFGHRLCLLAMAGLGALGGMVLPDPGADVQRHAAGRPGIRASHVPAAGAVVTGLVMGGYRWRADGSSAAGGFLVRARAWLGCVPGRPSSSCLAHLTFQRNQDYQSDLVDLAGHGRAKVPNNPRAHNNLGTPWPAADRSTRPSPITKRPWKSSPTTSRPTTTSA